MSLLEKELDKYGIVPSPLVDATKESEGKTTSIAADAFKTLLSSKETDTSSHSSSNSRENRTKLEGEVGSDGAADGLKIPERSSNAAAESNLETASNTVEPSAVCLIN